MVSCANTVPGMLLTKTSWLLYNPMSLNASPVTSGGPQPERHRTDPDPGVGRDCRARLFAAFHLAGPVSRKRLLQPPDAYLLPRCYLGAAFPEALAQLSLAVGYKIRHPYKWTADLYEACFPAPAVCDSHRGLRDTLNPQRYRMLYVSESRLTPTNFYQILLKQLGVHTVRNRAVAKQQLHEQLAVLQAVQDVSVVCVVDESHLLSFAMLEEIRFLLNTQFDSVSPIALILAGQPELWRRRLALEKCNAIRQRIDIQSVLNHYDRAYTGKYIQRQLAYAGATSELFTEKAVDQIYEYSSGIARMIDKVCTSVLIYGSQNRMRLIDDHAVAKVLEGEFS